MKSSSASSFKEVEVREKDAELSLSGKTAYIGACGAMPILTACFCQTQTTAPAPGVLPPDRSGCHLCVLSVVFLLLNRPAAVKLGKT